MFLVPSCLRSVLNNLAICARHPLWFVCIACRRYVSTKACATDLVGKLIARGVHIVTWRHRRAHVRYGDTLLHAPSTERARCRQPCKRGAIASLAEPYDPVTWARETREERERSHRFCEMARASCLCRRRCGLKPAQVMDTPSPGKRPALITVRAIATLYSARRHATASATKSVRYDNPKAPDKRSSPSSAIAGQAVSSPGGTRSLETTEFALSLKSQTMPT